MISELRFSEKHGVVGHDRSDMSEVAAAENGIPYQPDQASCPFSQQSQRFKV